MTEPAALPQVTIVLAVSNERKYIDGCLDAIAAQDYPAERMEVILVDGRSTDGTRDRLDAFAVSRSGVQVLDNPRGVVPSGLNIGIRHARGDLILRFDGHTRARPTYVSDCVKLLQSSGAANAGGVVVPVGRGYVAETIALASQLPFGLGGAAFRRRLDECAPPSDADTVFMGAFRREVFERVGLYNETFTRNQDVELNARIRRSGGKIILDPRIRTEYFCRDSLNGLWRQNFQTGMWLFETARQNPGALSVRHFVPLLFVSSVLISAVIAAMVPGGWMLLAAVLGSYAAASIAASVSAGLRDGLQYAVLLPVIFAVMHVSYGFGSLNGLLRVPARRLRHTRA